MNTYHLSKSRYCNGVQCHKMLWLKQHKPEEFDESVINEAVMANGNEVGDLAMGLFGDFVEVPFGDLSLMIEKTKELMEANTPIIAEASFSVDDLFCSVDILKNHGNGTIEIYEVKSSTDIKDIYYHDVAYQYYLLKKLGYHIKSCSLVYINKLYVRHGELDLSQLFIIKDVTDTVIDMQEGVSKTINSIRDYMLLTDEPNDDIGMCCFKPYSCGFFKYCTKSLPKPNVFQVAGLFTSKKLDCYYNNKISFEDLNDHPVLSDSQSIQVKHELFNYPPNIDKNAIQKFMKDMTYPLYFLDFESFQPAIPLFEDSKPYEQIVFQYSLHYIEHAGGELKHKEFLAYPGSDPRRELAEKLCEDIPLDVCTLAYNMAFEKGRIKSLAAIYPDLKDHLLNIHDHIVDLMIPFKKKWYYCKAMQGSYSIKYVLPALFPDDPSLNYQNLEGVHNGVEASETFSKMAFMNPDELEASRVQLLQYCGLDTYAMVKIWEKLKDI